MPNDPKSRTRMALSATLVGRLVYRYPLYLQQVYPSVTMVSVYDPYTSPLPGLTQLISILYGVTAAGTLISGGAKGCGRHMLLRFWDHISCTSISFTTHHTRVTYTYVCNLMYTLYRLRFGDVLIDKGHVASLTIS